MLYSHRSKTYEKAKEQGRDSRLNTGKVFSGDYWDDFGLLGGPKVDRILVLGAGYGACVRPMLAASPAARITLVDLDDIALRRSQTIHREHFPQISLEVLSADASRVEFPAQSFDLIWIDLFTESGYADCVQSISFYARLARMLTPHGQMAMNVFTTPTPFSEIGVSRAEAAATRFFTLLFPTVTRFPHRRNVTIVGSSQEGSLASENSNLKRVDTVTYDILRLRNANPLRALPQTSSDISFPTFAEIGQEMSEGWQKVRSLVDPSELTAFLKRPDLTATDLAQRAQDLKEMRYALPVMIGAHSDGVDWLARTYLDYLLEYGVEEAVVRPLKFIHYVLPQIASILCKGEDVDAIALISLTLLVERLRQEGPYEQ